MCGVVSGTYCHEGCDSIQKAIKAHLEVCQKPEEEIKRGALNAHLHSLNIFIKKQFCCYSFLLFTNYKYHPTL